MSCLDFLGFSDRHAVTNRGRYVYAVSYRASSIGDPDKQWQGKQSRSKQERAKERIMYATLAMWLSQPSNASFSLLIHAERTPESWIMRAYDKFPPLLFHEPPHADKYSREHFRGARKYYKTLASLPHGSNLWTLLGTLWHALSEREWPARYLLLWVVLEGLYGSSHPQETTFRLAQRAALHLERDRIGAQRLFREMKTAYSWRSRVAHGMQPAQMRKLTPELSNHLSSFVEQVVWRSLRSVLSSRTTIGLFANPKQRQTYLDELPFRR